MGRENWEFDRVPGSPKVIGSREGSVSLVVAGHCSRCGFMKKVKIKKTFKYALYDDGSNAYNFAIINAKNIVEGISKNDLQTEHIRNNKCHHPLDY